MAQKTKGVFAFLLELIIVFIGVYGAFELNRYQQNKREEKIKKNYFITFNSELTKLSSQISITHSQLNTLIVDFQNAMEKGLQPKPKPVNIFFDAPMLISRAGFNDDVFIQLSPELASSLSGGYDYVQSISERVKAFNQTCNQHLISNEPITFYDSKGSLKPQFNWYLMGLQDLRSSLKLLGQIINEVALPASQKIIEEFN